MGIFNDAGEAFNQVRDTIGDAAKQVTDTVGGAAGAQISYGIKAAGEAVNQITDTVDETVKNVLPGDIGKNLGLALYGIIAVAGIAVFVYILSLLKPLFEIGSNVSEK